MEFKKNVHEQDLTLLHSMSSSYEPGRTRNVLKLGKSNLPKKEKYRKTLKTNMKEG